MSIKKIRRDFSRRIIFALERFLALNQFVVEFNVFFGGIFPTVIAVHGVGGNLQPNFKLRVSRQCALERVHHFMRVVIRENKAIALFGVLVVLLNGIFQAASFANNWSCTVTHGDKLTNAARLVVGRHKENIAGGVHSLREFVREINIRRNFLRITPRQTFKPVFINLIASAEQDDPNP